MISANEVLVQALRLLGYIDDREPTQPDNPVLFRRGLAAVNQIYADLWNIEHRDEVFVPLNDMAQPLHLSQRAIADIVPYGVAMLMAQSDGDAGNQQLFASLYSQKRTAAKKPVMRRENVMFSGDGV